MSQSIHSHLEYGRGRYSYFGRIYLEWEPTFFAVLGGGPRQGQIAPCFALRGLPEGMNVLTSVAWYLRVTDRETDGERSVSRTDAERWVEQGQAPVGRAESCHGPGLLPAFVVGSRRIGASLQPISGARHAGIAVCPGGTGDHAPPAGGASGLLVRQLDHAA